MSSIALIAHDSRKPALVSFLSEREQWLWGRHFVATGLTAEVLEHGLKLEVQHLAAGRDGGYLELTRLAREGRLGMVIFFRDPEITQDYEADVVEFVKTCIRENIPLASNPASAELLIVGMIRMEGVRR
ncbi:MAG: methylglyoxal synthase [Flavobacteriales bacterium]|jgi:methylglyoxal synthase